MEAVIGAIVGPKKRSGISQNGANQPALMPKTPATKIIKTGRVLAFIHFSTLMLL
jgi:hypothetical protein